MDTTKQVAPSANVMITPSEEELRKPIKHKIPKQPTARLMRLNVTKKFDEHLDELHQDLDTINYTAPPELVKDIRESRVSFIAWLLVLGAEVFLAARAERKQRERVIITPGQTKLNMRGA